MVNRKSATENLKYFDVLADYYRAKSVDHLSHGPDSRLRLYAFLSEVRLGTGHLCGGRNH